MFGVVIVIVNCFLLQTAVSQEFLRGEKPGSCNIPNGFDFGICPFYCKKDSDCGFNLKCCPLKCGGFICTVPINRTSAVETVQAVVEAGDMTTTTVASNVISDSRDSCPGPLFESSQCGPLKFATCTKDSHCIGNMKCCFNGCVNTCRAPQRARSGYCPALNIRCRRKICSADSDCTQGLKCCSGGCICSVPRGLGIGFGGSFGG